MNESPVIRCIRRANELKLRAAEEELHGLASRLWSERNPLSGVSLRPRSQGNTPETILKRIALAPVGLLLLLVLALMTPLSYLDYLRALPRERAKLRRTIQGLSRDPATLGVPPERTLRALWTRHGFNDWRHPGIEEDLLCEWVDILYGHGRSTELRVRARIRGAGRSISEMNQPYYEGRPGALHVYCGNPIEIVLDELSEELPPLPTSGSNRRSKETGTASSAGNVNAIRRNVRELLTDTATWIFRTYRVSDPTDSQKMKAYFYLCVAAMAIVNDSGGATLQQLLESLLDETKELTKSLAVRIEELSGDSRELGELLAAFPDQLHLTGSATINGLAALDALYRTKLEALAGDILNHSGGPFGAPGYAAIVVVDGILGKGKSKDHFPETAIRFIEFTKKLDDLMLEAHQQRPLSPQ